MEVRDPGSGGGADPVLIRSRMNIQYGEPTLGSSYSVVGSFPKSFGYGGEDQDLDPEEANPSASRPRILLMGLRRSGKSSIQKVPRF